MTSRQTPCRHAGTRPPGSRAHDLDAVSYPENPCTPNSDANAPAPSCIGVTPSCLQANAGGGSAFMELQFYPPGEAPFADSISCANTHWCAALTIDSLECTLNFATCNPSCTEPVNFGFIQTNGVPAGPPSPRLSDLATFTPKALLMNPGDKITVHMFDAPLSGGGHAFEAVVRDATTGQAGFMQAPAANGFMNTSVSTCDGTPFNFQPEYSTASAETIVPWAALEVNISTEFEIGHFEPCSTVTSPATISLASGVTDIYWKHCVGAYENTTAPDGGKNPETSDTPCYPRGDTPQCSRTAQRGDRLPGVLRPERRSRFRRHAVLGGSSLQPVPPPAPKP
jgi:hypothetical protein